jgi:histidine triad (HIT) family protein
MASIFSRIINGEIPCYKIAENDDFLAFLDITPVEKGHTLVVPKKEVDYIFDMEDEDLAKLHLFAKRVAKAVKKAVPCLRIGVAVIGLEVPHTHVHLVPLHNTGSLSFTKERIKMTNDEFLSLSTTINTHFV